ncbi:MAG: FAD-dependent oxidoreductase [Nitrosopumilus sp.]|nr:FAD-dependent oxidoreductase [Nitrosopumilus sp.]
MKEYDVVIIGAGSGGLVAATTANRKGLKVALLEKNKIGGECTHYGCIPSKALLHSAKMYEATKNLHENYGLDGLQVSGKLNFGAVMEHVDTIVNGVYRQETPEIFEKQGIDVYINNLGAKFISKNAVKIGDDILDFKYAVICTGSSPQKVNVPGSNEIDFLHNENFWELRKLPESIIFIGGGVVSAELGQALSRFGSRVTILDRNPGILKPVDNEAAEIITNIFKAEGINIICSSELKDFRKENEKVFVGYLQNGERKEISVERIFLAIGRQPNVTGLDLEKAEIEFSKKGISTNAFLQTSTPTIYACGDITASLKFTHTASYQASIIIENILNGNKKENDLSIFPWAIFTEPEIAHVGLTEKQARDKFGNNISIFKVDATIDRFITDKSTIGFLKVIFNSDNLVIGAEAIGAHAGEWIQFLTIAIKNKIPAENFADTIFIYPTYSEIVKKAFTRFLRSKE